MADTLTSLGKILGLIGGILAIVGGVSHLIDQAVNELVTLGNYGGEVVGGGTAEAILAIIIGILTILICVDRYKIKDKIVLGIVLIVLGLLGATIFAILGGILVIIDHFM